MFRRNYINLGTGEHALYVLSLPASDKNLIPKREVKHKYHSKRAAYVTLQHTKKSKNMNQKHKKQFS